MKTTGLKHIFLLLTLTGGVCIFVFIFITFDMRDNHGVKDPLAKNWKTVFRDDFSGDSLDETKWSTCYEWYRADLDGCSNNGNNELQWYQKDRVKVADGLLTLTAGEKIVTGWGGEYNKTFPYTSGMVSTGRSTWNGEPKWDGLYGSYEARLRVPSGKGVWPAFWLLPTDKKWPPEIDIMELLGDKPNQILTTYHYGETLDPQKDESIYQGTDFTRDWHTYSVNWSPTKIEWRIDGKVVKVSTGENIPKKPMQIILNLAIGGNLPGKPDATTKFPVEMHVDYVQVKQPPQ